MAKRWLERLFASDDAIGLPWMTLWAFVRLSTNPRVRPDAALAALALENGATLASSDQDFRRFPGLRWVNPLST